MNRSMATLLCAFPAAALILLGGCRSGEEQEVARTPGAETPAAETVAATPEIFPALGIGQFADTSAALSPVVYADGSRTLNDACPVRKGKLSLSRIPISVNGHPVGFC
jgi:hypothetical protein